MGARCLEVLSVMCIDPNRLFPNKLYTRYSLLNLFILEILLYDLRGVLSSELKPKKMFLA